ncbi:protein of unknown function UPF0054 [Pirellula staleyi DSM 6068]|uniref:Endoribonuclease YbeY n=1 Tax=Pirellula staleyi (strain ATCC 27377 / DSM 6068 / ICPB 4128) TaxID=530564 RepID=D2R5M1_PIRSD|nr:protein of unknown function UPF0054 [Pirellula staleyi DSM 6068]
MIDVQVTNRQTRHKIDKKLLSSAVRKVLALGEIKSAEISVAVVDGDEMHQLNRQYLQHDYTTDCLSFVLDFEDDHLEGEVIVSADYAAQESLQYGWRMEDELLLYVIHASLHLIGHDDHEESDIAKMREAEKQILAQFGLERR